MMERNWINRKSVVKDAVDSETSLSRVKVVSQITNIRSVIHLNMEERPTEKLHTQVTTVTSKVTVPQIAGRKREKGKPSV